MSKHTPGPWFGRPSHDPVLIQGADDVGLSIAFACGGGDPRREEFKANARLIAAAPDLLEALIWMVENDETNEGDTPMPDHYGATWNEINEFWIKGLNRARAAIAKATGEGA